MSLNINVSLKEPKPTEVFDTYWYFAAERQNVFYSRISGADPPWTDDFIIQRYRFTNTYRASDRVSQYLIAHVIDDTRYDPDDTFFRILLFKIFNRMSTWKLFEAKFGTVTLDACSYGDLDSVLTEAMRRKERIFSGAYIMPSGVSSFGSTTKHRNYLSLLELMMSDQVPEKIQSAKSLYDVFEILVGYPMMGKFLAYQYCIDLNYSSLINFVESEFVQPGPGAIDGISKCFSDLGDYSEADAIKWVTDRQDIEFQSRGILFRDLWGRSMQLIDCQNVFCEIGKYARVRYPESVGISGRTRIKQIYKCAGNVYQPTYPRKWDLKIARESRDINESIQCG